MSNLPEEEIRELWEAAGKPEGKDEEFWPESERQLKEAMVRHRTPDTL